MCQSAIPLLVTQSGWQMRNCLLRTLMHEHSPQATGVMSDADRVLRSGEELIENAADGDVGENLPD